tara:strand:- start:72 stop:461 length:390 start_codon:yes stop_codon:yes gene_type:complete
MEDIKTLSFDGKPYLIFERSNGIFQAVSTIDEDNDGWDYEPKEGLDNLVLGEDIVELPTRGLSILVNHIQPEDNALIFSVATELIKFASVSWSDYVSYEISGRYYAKLLNSANEDEDIYEVKPRLFRKA